jgi:hypothetical protein
MKERLYLPTLSDLIDRLSIVQLKEIFIPESAKEYSKEKGIILHDINIILEEKGIGTNAEFILNIMLIMLSNRFIWENESLARLGENDQDKRLKLTHSINGIRNIAKNCIASKIGDRVDRKIDCFAADLDKEFGNWNIFQYHEV